MARTRPCDTLADLRSPEASAGPRVDDLAAHLDSSLALVDQAGVRTLRAVPYAAPSRPGQGRGLDRVSGGHSGCLLSLVDNPALEGGPGIIGPSGALVAVVAWFPRTDLLGLVGDLVRAADPTSDEFLLLGATATRRPDLVSEASSLSHVVQHSALAATTAFLLHHLPVISASPRVES